MGRSVRVVRMFLRTTGKDIRRNLVSFGFWLSVGLAVIILLTGAELEGERGETYNIVTAMLYLDEAKLQMLGWNADMVFSGCLWSSMPMYGMLLAALSFAVNLCEEQKHGVRRYILMKEGKWNYTLSKAVSAMLVSGIAFLLSTLVVCLIVHAKFPVMSEEDLSWRVEVLKLPPSVTQALLGCFGARMFSVMGVFGAFLYGVFCGFAGYLCSAFFSNVYLVVCIPFFFGYMYYSILQVLMGMAIEGRIPWEQYNLLDSHVSPHGYMNFWQYWDAFGWNMLALVVLWGFSIGIYYLRIHKAVDCGVK